MLPVILGLSGPCLTADERALFGEAEPAGYILFGRNCVDREQVRALTDELRALSGRDDLPVLIDQEGGTVARLKPPAWPELPGAGPFDRLYRLAPISAIEAMRHHGRAIAALLREVGASVNCAPMLDIGHPDSHPIIADRALGQEPMQVTALGRAMLDGMRSGGVAGVLKHAPGHGRATADSHAELPIVDTSEDALEEDIRPFRSLAWAPIVMSAHVVYRALDPDWPATLSPLVIGKVIRGRIGFDGLLISDDIGMGALSGDVSARALAAIKAGCDLALHCSGDLDEGRAICAGLPEIGSEASRRLDQAVAWAADLSGAMSYEQAASRRDALLAYAPA
jgi:beta-N-acetylhexosaminidase